MKNKHFTKEAKSIYSVICHLKKLISQLMHTDKLTHLKSCDFKILLHYYKMLFKMLTASWMFLNDIK